MSEWINVKLKDVLRAEIIHKMGPLKTERNCCFPNNSPLKKGGGGSYPFQVLEVTYAQETKDSDKWVDVRLELNHNDFNLLTQWAQTLQYFLGGSKIRRHEMIMISVLLVNGVIFNCRIR